jgi:polysaccharide pyruvyl transferase WcaK-like protein
VGWAPLLARAPVVTVRGPLSQARLADVGVRSIVSGDPALLAADGYVPGVEKSPGLVGLNLGVHFSMTEAQRRGLLELYVAVGAELARAGHRLVVLPVWGPDVAISQELARRLGPSATVIDAHDSTSRFLAAVGECELVIAQKLHAAVLAAAVDVPAIAIEYQPKCRDFQASVGREEWCYGLDVVPGAVLEGVDVTFQALEEQTSAMRGEVQTLRVQLREAAVVLRDRVLGG